MSKTDIESLSAIHTATDLSSIPTFTSLFIGKTLAEVNQVFTTLIEPLPSTNERFSVVLDQRSIDDETCLIVEGGENFNPEDERTWLRTDFYLPLHFITSAEVEGTNVGQEMDRQEVWGIENIDVNTLP